MRSPTATQRSIHERPVGDLAGFPGPNGHEGMRDEPAMREIVGGGRTSEGRQIYSTRYLSVGEGLEPVGKVVRRSLGGSRTKLLKMDEISDLPASGLPARSSQAIRQVPPTAR